MEVYRISSQFIAQKIKVYLVTVHNSLGNEIVLFLTLFPKSLLTFLHLHTAIKFYFPFLGKQKNFLLKCVLNNSNFNSQKLEH